MAYEQLCFERTECVCVLLPSEMKGPSKCSRHCSGIQNTMLHDDAIHGACNSKEMSAATQVCQVRIHTGPLNLCLHL